MSLLDNRTLPSYAPDPYKEARQEDYTTRPFLRTRIKADIQDVYEGVGSQYADDLAAKIQQQDKTGEKLSYEFFKDTDFAKNGVKWYDGITAESAAELENYAKQQQDIARIRELSTNSQAAISFAASLGAGIFEEKNIKYGIAGAVIAAPVWGIAASAARSTRMAYNAVARANRASQTVERGALTARQIAGRGAVEGFVSAAIMEPSNRHSAEILQQDYTMADSLFNVATSSLFGAGFAAVPEYVRRKISDYRSTAKAHESVLREFEVATTQAALGQRLNVSAVDQAMAGAVEAKPASEQLNIIRNSVLKENGTNILPSQDEIALPADLQTDKASGALRPLQWREGLSPKTLNDLQNPASYVVRELETGKTIMETFNPEVVARLNTAKYEAVPAAEHLANLNGQSFAAEPGALTKAEKVRAAALGNQTAEGVMARINAQNKTAASKAVQDAVDPLNDTSIDIAAINRLEDYEETLALQKHADELQRFDAYIEEINALEAQGVISAEEVNSINDLLNSVNEEGLLSAWEAARICLTRG